MEQGDSIMVILEADRLAQSYGGLQVLTEISFRLMVGEKVALIGPNGAGKTTLFNVLSGFVPLNAGKIHFLGQEITHLQPEARASLGLARSFQISTLFPSLNVLTNVLLAIQGVQTTRYRMFRPIMSYRDNLAKARELLELVGLWEKRESLISNLGHGEQRQMEIILSLASKPKLLLLDEPSAGLTAGESDKLIDMLHSLVADTTVLLTAHDTDLVFELAERVMVLYYGKIIAQGTPEEIQNDPEVREIYLGSEEKAQYA
jgi:branched-chain amino acid transport system ATP-binding protein